MPKVLMLPTPTQAAQNTTNAIHQIVLKLAQHLPAYGYAVTENPAEADLIAGHAGQTYGQGTKLDVAHCHGLYPTQQFPDMDWHWQANETVIRNLRSARAITVPSQWVADILRRDMHVEPHVIGWAIEPDDWTPADTHRGYVLWNKTRQDKVCDPSPLITLAQQFPDQSFVTTFGSGGKNVTTLGLQSHADMRETVRGAEVYLATTKETFGIGTLEAMASGIPVLGYRWGGTADIVEHGITGYLVHPGDLEGLARGLVYCRQHRAILGANARARALTYTWERVAAQVAKVYDTLLVPDGDIKVSVVIPLHNYGRYVGETIDSVKAQQTTFKIEIIVVENGSTDDSHAVAVEHLGTARGGVVVCSEGVGPAHARNLGIERARGQYICCLDADDKLASPDFLQRLAETLDADPLLGIAFSGLSLFREVNGQREYRGSAWPDGFSFEAQCQGRNQIPTCCLFRKDAWQRAGGYRSAPEPAEDAELWLRITSLGYGAKQVTKEPWFHYRWHDQSLSHAVRSQQVQEPDWRRWHPYTRSGNKPLAAVGTPRKHSYPVRNYDRPLVSVIIPVGKGHPRYIQEALDSVEGQTEWRWECIVVNDTGEPLRLYGQPWARVIDTVGGVGPGAARNLGIAAATAPLIAFLDADDLLEPRFLELTLQAHYTSGRYIYTDWMTLDNQGNIGKHDTPEYEPGLVFFKTSVHSVNILIERDALRAVGGFDEHLTAWEDVDLMMKLAAAGYCGQRVPQYLVYYRHQTGTVRERGEQVKADLKALLYERYRPYMERQKMCSCIQAPKSKVMNSNGEASTPAESGMIRVIYQGAAARHEVIGHVTRQRYGRRAGGEVFLVWQPDQQATPDLFAPLAALETLVEATPEPPEPTLTEAHGTLAFA